MALRAANALLGDTTTGNFGGFAQGENRTMLDPRKGGSMGYWIDQPTFVNHTPYVQRNLITKVLAGPNAFALLPDSDVWYGTLKAMWEERATSIDGLHRKITGEFASAAYGGAGEEQEVLKNSTRERSQPVWNGIELEGRPLTTFVDLWHTLFGVDPDTKWPLITTYTNRPTDNLPDTRSATILFMEPNQTLTGIEKAWIVVDMFPKEGFDDSGKFDKTAPGDIIQASIPFTGMAHSNLACRAYALQVLQSMNFVGANPNLQQPVISSLADIDPKLSTAGASYGYSDQVASAASQTLQV